jgi:transcription-repair coupling factor (superfamily II helicase)
MKTKLPVTRITKYLNVTINSASKRLFEKQNITLKELTTLSVGDYVTHDHGIGRFGGLQKKKSKAKHKKLSSSFMPILCM